MNPGENPDNYFNKKILLRGELGEMGELITDRRFKDMCKQGTIDEYKTSSSSCSATQSSRSMQFSLSCATSTSTNSRAMDPKGGSLLEVSP